MKLQFRAICRAPSWCQAGCGVRAGQARWVPLTTTTFLFSKYSFPRCYAAPGLRESRGSSSAPSSPRSSGYNGCCLSAHHL